MTDEIDRLIARSQAAYDDGYDWIERVAGTAIASWGRDGWDLGDWPLVAVSLHKTRDGYKVVTRCEGDFDTYHHATVEDAKARIDDLAIWYWLGDLDRYFGDRPEEHHRLVDPLLDFLGTTAFEAAEAQREAWKNYNRTADDELELAAYWVRDEINVRRYSPHKVPWSTRKEWLEFVHPQFRGPYRRES